MIPGGIEIAVLVFVCVLLFGSSKIPSLARSVGEAFGEYKKGKQELEQDFKE